MAPAASRSALGHRPRSRSRRSQSDEHRPHCALVDLARHPHSNGAGQRDLDRSGRMRRRCPPLVRRRSLGSRAGDHHRKSSGKPTAMPLRAIASRRPPYKRLRLIPWRRAISDTLAPGCVVALMMLAFCSELHRRGRSGPDRTSPAIFSTSLSPSSRDVLNPHRNLNYEGRITALTNDVGGQLKEHVKHSGGRTPPVSLRRISSKSQSKPTRILTQRST